MDLSDKRKYKIHPNYISFPSDRNRGKLVKDKETGKFFVYQEEYYDGGWYVCKELIEIKYAKQSSKRQLAVCLCLADIPIKTICKALSMRKETVKDALNKYFIPISLEKRLLKKQISGELKEWIKANKEKDSDYIRY